MLPPLFTNCLLKRHCVSATSNKVPYATHIRGTEDRCLAIVGYCRRRSVYTCVAKSNRVVAATVLHVAVRGRKSNICNRCSTIENTMSIIISPVATIE